MPAAPDGSPERRSLEDESSSLSQRTRQAEQDNATIYQDPVPSAGALPRLEPKLFVKPIRPEEGLSSAQVAYADAFPALLPAATAAAVTQFHGEATGGVGVLEELLSACTALEKEAHCVAQREETCHAVGAATMANEVLKAEEEKDAALLSDEPRLTRPLVVSEYDALQRRREALLAAVAEQHALFVGLTEGHRFYKVVVLTELRKASEKGAEIADLREAERASLLRRMNEPPPTFTQATAQPAAAHAAPSSYAGGGASLAEARAAWQASHAGAGGASPPPTTIMCYGCRNKFGVPPNTAIVACPFCKTHNRVPP
ncbi:hypothetical protein EMIHUDRAFT_244504 [Emiliania huxleyi CCMP1516]|uniref:BRO1 domain-containing protein n=2 Tax=Emiliania huxleyi TaxID=2903 RepID=A0A0D3J0P3_EMIH1|nr:hypothetical protein EMIHUDRAFT_244504 [Emiliania huxleyi CCMP1516]EOD17078.1 hypothetical protein EMIHUDRAFT_244504 [Emiliania huxleyi CCMP1516]|eukprot:XP_005769507.1 hypothetical protein EMIHUDRAFT_244504 [Emiliania huxleyi CCMP1516]